MTDTNVSIASIVIVLITLLWLSRDRLIPGRPAEPPSATPATTTAGRS